MPKGNRYHCGSISPKRSTYHFAYSTKTPWSSPVIGMVRPVEARLLLTPTCRTLFTRSTRFHWRVRISRSGSQKHRSRGECESGGEGIALQRGASSVAEFHKCCFSCVTSRNGVTALKVNGLDVTQPVTRFLMGNGFFWGLRNSVMAALQINPVLSIA